MDYVQALNKDPFAERSGIICLVFVLSARVEKFSKKNFSFEKSREILLDVSRFQFSSLEKVSKLEFTSP